MPRSRKLRETKLVTSASCGKCHALSKAIERGGLSDRFKAVDYTQLDLETKEYLLEQGVKNLPIFIYPDGSLENDFPKMMEEIKKLTEEENHDTLEE